MSGIKAKLMDAHAKVEACESIDDDHKDALADLIRSTEHASNGAPDKIDAMSQVMGHLVLCYVRGELRMPARVKREVAAHVADCPLRGGTVAGTVAATCKAIAPVAWPMGLVACAAIFSPYIGPGVLGLLEMVVKR